MSIHSIAAVWLDWLWQTTWQTALLAVAIGCTTWLLRRWISPGARQALWLLVFLRLMMPFLPASRFSIWGFYTQPETKSEQIEVQTVHYDNAQLPAMTEHASSQSFIAPPSPSIFEYPRTWLAILWAAGAMLVFGHTVFSTFRFASAIRRTARQPDEMTVGLIKECLVLSPRSVLWERVRVRVLPRIVRTVFNRDRTLTPALSRSTGRGRIFGTLRVVLTDKVATPGLFGVFRPKLLLPPRITSTLDSQALRNVILHELQHLKRHHLAMDWLLTAVRSVHWFNPAAWWAHRQIRAAREFICDQAVIAGLADHNAPQHYGHTLLTIACGALRSGEPALVAAFARDQKLLRERIETIARFGKVKYIAGLGIFLFAALMAVFLTSPSKRRQAEKSAAPATNPTTAPSDRIPYVDVLNASNWPDLSTIRNSQERGQRAEDQAVYAALDRKLPEFRLNNVAFTDVIEYLRNVSGAEIYVNWRALEASGVDRSVLVSVYMKEVKFSKILDTILKDVGGGNVALTYTVDQGVITISTEEDLASNVITRVYDIRDLVQANPGDPKLRQELIIQMIKLIEDTISPTYWKDRGGKTATIRQLPGTAQLIITQTPENHQKLGAFLDQLRETRAIQIRVDAKILEVPAKWASEIEQHLDKNAQIFLDDRTVGEYLAAPDASIVALPRLTLFNGQQAVINLDQPHGESSAFRVQSTVSEDHKNVTVTPWMIYSPNSAVSAPEQMQLGQALSALTSAKIDTIEARTQYGAGHPEVAQAEQREETLYSAWQVATKAAVHRNAANSGEQWVLSSAAVSVPNGATLLVRNARHSVVQTKPDGSTETIDAPPGDKVIWLLIRPTIIIQREREQEQFPLLQK